MRALQRSSGLLIAVLLLAGCGGARDSAGTAPSTPDNGMVTAVDPDGDSRTENGNLLTSDDGPSAGTIRIGPWAGREVTSICVEATEDCSWSVLLPNDADPSQPIETMTPITPAISPIADALSAGLEDGNLAVVPAGCDATLEIDAHGTVLAESYQAAGRLFTGADLQVTITLSAEGAEPLTSAWSSRKDPPDTYVAQQGDPLPEMPDNAPIFDTVEKDLCDALKAWIEGPFNFQQAFGCWRI